jgi:hypothetical protein
MKKVNVMLTCADTRIVIAALITEQRPTDERACYRAAV